MTTTTVPLSTVFTAPASCSTSWTYEAQTYNSITSGILLQNAIDGFLDTDCFPPGFANAGRGSASQIFSPGACPFGYVTQLNSINGVSTTATCCSSDFSFTQTSGLSGCLSTYKGATSLVARSGGFGSADTTSHTSISGTFTMWGIPIIVAVQSSQFSLYTTSTSSTASLTSSTQSTSTIPSATSMSTGTTTLSLVRLSAGAKAGIAVGVIGGVIFLLSMALLFWRHRRKALARQDSLGPALHVPGGLLYHDGYPYQADPVELGQHAHRVEVKPAAELSSPQQLVELGT